MTASDTTIRECDLFVIGAGMAGMSAALFANRLGLSVIQAGNVSELIFSTGYFDLMGVHPIDSGTIWTDPWAAVDAVRQDLPKHPYARISNQDIQASIEVLTRFLAESGLPYHMDRNRNQLAMTPVGTLKPTYCIPHTMRAQAEMIQGSEPCLIIDIKGLKGFSARQIAETLGKKRTGIRPARIAFPGADQLNEIYTEQLARRMDTPAERTRIAELIRPLIGDASYVGLPAICGMYATGECLSSLEEQIGVPVFEIPAMPPGVTGLRLKEAFEQGLSGKGVLQMLQRDVIIAEKKNDRFECVLDDPFQGTTIRSKGVILASGRFLGRGLAADRKRIRETIFNLPVYQPGQRVNWHRETFLDHRGHPVNQAGVEIDEYFRPLDHIGRCAHETLFAAGSIIGRQDWMRMKCGSGLAIASAYAAVQSFMEISGESYKLLTKPQS